MIANLLLRARIDLLMRWMWIDTITNFQPGKSMTALKHVSRAEEHLADHFAEDHQRNMPALAVMPASLVIEGMAQTAGILVGACNDFQEKVILAKVVIARLSRDARPGDSLRYHATLDRIDRAGAATSGEVALRSGGEDAWNVIGQIDLLFSHIDNNMAGIEFPEENFVFSDNFRSILRDVGIVSDGSS
ncbi:MAG: beta-hydroxyacyl-ACP dehydratase [Phycisphaerales bacterium]